MPTMRGLMSSRYGCGFQGFHRNARVGNALRKLETLSFMNTNMSFTSTEDMSVARILVSLNLRKGLSNILELTRGGLLFRKTLDYKGIPFKCHRCHKHGQRVVDFTLPMKRIVPIF
jgi:hypothetical protein